MDKQEKLFKAVQTFQSSNQTTEDYLKFAMTIRVVTTSGSGLVWSEIENVFNDALNPISDFNRVYPTFKSYMYCVDEQLEAMCGLGHEHLPDFMWMDAYEEEVLPNDIAKEFYKTYITEY